MRAALKSLLPITVLLFCSALAYSQAVPGTELQEYQAAVAKPRGAEQVAALERFAAAHPQSKLKIDALELLVWGARQAASTADLEYWAGQLMSVSPDNPLASAVIIGDSLNIGGENRISYAKRTLSSVERFDRPEGMSHDDFEAVKNFVVATLNGVVGYSYFEQKDFNAARPYLRRAVEADPRNAQYTYTLALSDLEGANPDQAEGYKMLARSVNLTKGTPSGNRLAEFARQNYQKAGGTSENWDKYLAATAVAPLRPAEAPMNAATVAASTSGSPARSAASTSAATRREPIFIATNTSPAMPGRTTSSSPVLAASAPAPAPAAAASVDSERPLRVFPPRPAKHIAPGSPVSVGVLIQASLANPADRKPVVYTLSDLVRHLRDKDEAFIMSFSRGVVFQEDLTSNSKSLESAMDDIAPTPGSAIYDAVTFAAGHLDRVARNKNRILLVIAAEGDRNSTVSPLELSSEINLSGVTIYCIGVGMAMPADQSRLEALAESTGGHAVFISDLSRFREATRSIAQGLGISFPQ